MHYRTMNVVAAFLLSALLMLPVSGCDSASDTPAVGDVVGDAGAATGDDVTQAGGDDVVQPAGDAGGDEPCSPSGLSPEFAAALQATLDEQRAALGTPGMAAAVLLPCEGLWVGTSGVSDVPAGTLLAEDDRFRIASITKTYVAALTLALVDDGALSLDTPIADVLTDSPFLDAGITVRQLLNHTACLPDFTDDEAFLAALGDVSRAFTPEELLAYVAGADLLCEPGADYYYSNTGYVLLGLVLEEVGGASLESLVASRVLTPLDLDDTAFPEAAAAPGTIVGYARSEEAAGGFVESGVSLSSAWAAGGMVATVADVARWTQALYGGAFLGAERLAEMTTCGSTGFEGEGYGLGTQCIETPIGTLLGHGGGTWGFTGGTFYLPTADASVVVLSNLEDADLQEALSALVMQVVMR